MAARLTSTTLLVHRLGARAKLAAQVEHLVEPGSDSSHDNKDEREVRERPVFKKTRFECLERIVVHVIVRCLDGPSLKRILPSFVRTPAPEAGWVSGDEFR